MCAMPQTVHKRKSVRTHRTAGVSEEIAFVATRKVSFRPKVKKIPMGISPQLERIVTSMDPSLSVDGMREALTALGGAATTSATSSSEFTSFTAAFNSIFAATPVRAPVQTPARNIVRLPYQMGELTSATVASMVVRPPLAEIQRWNVSLPYEQVEDYIDRVDGAGRMDFRNASVRDVVLMLSDMGYVVPPTYTEMYEFNDLRTRQFVFEFTNRTFVESGRAREEVSIQYQIVHAHFRFPNQRSHQETIQGIINHPTVLRRLFDDMNVQAALNSTTSLLPRWATHVELELDLRRRSYVFVFTNYHPENL